MKEKAKAKINLGLWIHGKYPDGYHNLSTLLLPLDLYDEISIQKSREFFIHGPNFGPDDYMTKAKNRLQKKVGKSLPINIKIKKNIPIGAGLAGGTADGAAVFRGINKLYNLNYSNKELQHLSSTLGADFPYCLMNLPAIGKGKGNDLEEIDSFPDIPILLLNPGYSIATKDAYSWVESYSDRINFTPILECLKEKKYHFLDHLIVNDLEKGVSKKFKEIKKMKIDLYNAGADFALMTGSGPTVYGFFSSEETRDSALSALKNKYEIAIGVKVLGGIKNG